MPKEIAGILGLRSSQVSDIVYLIKSYETNRPNRKIPVLIKEVIDKIKSNPRLIETSSTQNVSMDQNIAFFEKLFSDFQKGLVQFIKIEVDRQAIEKVTQKEKELSDLKAKYEQKLIRMQEIIVEMQDSSAVGMIKKLLAENN